jgi:hypothetical protein
MLPTLIVSGSKYVVFVVAILICYYPFFQAVKIEIVSATTCIVLVVPILMPFDVFFFDFVLITKFVYQNNNQNLLFQSRVRFVKISVNTYPDVAAVAVLYVCANLMFISTLVNFVFAYVVVISKAALPLATVAVVSVNFV